MARKRRQSRQNGSAQDANMKAQKPQEQVPKNGSTAHAVTPSTAQDSSNTAASQKSFQAKNVQKKSPETSQKNKKKPNPYTPFTPKQPKDRYASKKEKKRQRNIANRNHCTNLASEKLEHLRRALESERTQPQNSTSIKEAEKNVHDAEVDYNYCLYFPADEMFRPPPGPPASRRKRPPRVGWRKRSVDLYALVDKHLSEGTMDALGKGQIEPPVLDGPISQPSQAAVNPSHALVKTDANGADQNKGFLIRSNGISDLQIKTAQYEEDYNVFDESSDEDDDDPDEINDRKEESDGAVGDTVRFDASNQMIMNFHGSLPEKPDQASEITAQQVSSSVPEPPTHDPASAGLSEEGEMQESRAASVSGDPMMEYSNSNGFQRPLSNPVKASADSPKIHRLADLDAGALILQLKYFYFAKALKDVDLQQPVKCLYCGDMGHDSDACGTLSCRECGAPGAHLTELCPERAKCPKCRESGHMEPSCPYKLKRVAKEEVICGICGITGHVEQDCELLWRTSGRPWEFDVFLHDVRTFCYECGNQGHLGNDCPSRQPGKPLGTSSWTALGLFGVPAVGQANGPQPARPKNTLRHPQKTDELKIRGRAGDQQPQRSRFDDQSAPGLVTNAPLPRPTHMGQIKIAPVISRSLDRPRDGLAPVSRPGREFDSFRRNVRGDFRPEFDEFDDARYSNDYNDRYSRNYYRDRSPDYGDGYRSRSRSPPQERSRYYGSPSSRYRGYPPASRAPQDAYRPMPSAAQKAWSKHRI